MEKISRLLKMATLLFLFFGFILAGGILLIAGITHPLIWGISIVFVLLAALTLYLLHKKILLHVKERDNWYSQLLDLVAQPITVTDLNMNWTFINKAVEGLLGKSRKEVAGTHCSNWGAGICKTVNCGIERLRNGYNQTIFTQWGLDFLVDTHYLYDLKGNPVGHVEIVTDIDTKVKVRSQIKNAINEISEGSRQIALTSQDLSQGASESAASLEEISATVGEIRDQAKMNYGNASQASGINQLLKNGVLEGNQEMKNLIDAMAEINSSSGEIKKIVKVIDDIAFQINLLALNANVEAARAGKYGKGFAVVADEVRNLAIKSASYANETTGMVERAIKNVNIGNSLVEKVSNILNNILLHSDKSLTLNNEVEASSHSQAEAIEELNRGLIQIEAVTQSTTASSEETSAAANALSEQVANLLQIVNTMKLDNDNEKNEKLEQLLFEVKKNETKQKALPPGK